MRFNRQRLIGNRPIGIYDGDIVMTASRPLLGVDIDDITVQAMGLRGFTVVIMASTYRRQDLLEHNQRMDARVIEWISAADAIESERARLAASYGAAAMNVLSDDDLIDSWLLHNRFDAIDVDPADVALVDLTVSEAMIEYDAPDTTPSDDSARLAERHYEVENGGL